MDCEKCEELLLDELYGELDEVTHAAVRRHMAGCARCSGLLAGMRATRKLAAMPLEPVPAGLEERILDAETLHRVNLMRRHLMEMHPVQAMESLLAQMGKAASNQVLLDRMRVK